jgi:hypothetical protein
MRAKEQTMPTDDRTTAIENAATHLRVTAASLETALRTRDAAQATLVAAAGYREAGRNAKAKLATLRAEDELERAALRVTECEKVNAAARMMWETLVRQAYVAREIARTQAALTAAQALATALHAGLADRQATAQLLGCVDSGSHPAAHAAAFTEALAAHLRHLDPPPPAPTPPPPPGFVRLLTVAEFLDAREQWRHQAGTIVTLPADEAAQVVKRGWATVVEA